MNNDTPQPTVKDSSVVQKPRCPWPVHLWHPASQFFSAENCVDNMPQCGLETILEPRRWVKKNPKGQEYVVYEPSAYNYGGWYYDQSVWAITRGHVFPKECGGYCWTRAEALGSQWTDNPDQGAGVYLIKSKQCEHHPYTDYLKKTEAINAYSENDGREVLVYCGELSMYKVGGFRFYYMGLLPTAIAEGEVVP